MLTSIHSLNSQAILLNLVLALYLFFKYYKNLNMELSIKRRPQSGEVCPRRIFCKHEERGSSDAVVRIFGSKDFGFFETYAVSARTREEGVNFLQFCQTSFMDDP